MNLSTANFDLLPLIQVINATFLHFRAVTDFVYVTYVEAFATIKGLQSKLIQMYLVLQIEIIMFWVIWVKSADKLIVLWLILLY